MGSPNELDYGGLTLLVKEVKTGNAAPGQSGTSRQVTAAGSAVTITRASHLGKVILLDTASGSVATLPAASGSGDSYKFVVTTTVTSNSHKIQVANASDTMIGFLNAVTGAAASGDVGDLVGGTDDTLTMNGTTTGGILGTVITVTDIATNLWLVEGTIVASGIVADVSSAAV